MKSLLLTVIATTALLANPAMAATPGGIPAGTKINVKLNQIRKTDNFVLTPSMPLFAGVPKLVKGRIYEFKIGTSGQLLGPLAINIPWDNPNKLPNAPTVVPGTVNYIKVTKSGTLNLDVFTVLATVYKSGGKPVGVSITYTKTTVIPFSNKSVTMVFEKP